MNKFLALSDPKRRMIVEILCMRGEMTVNQINEGFDISPPAISQHLKVLREAGLVKVEKRAQKRVYSINPDGIEAMWLWIGRIRSYTTGALPSL